MSKSGQQLVLELARETAGGQQIPTPRKPRVRSHLDGFKPSRRSKSGRQLVLKLPRETAGGQQIPTPRKLSVRPILTALSRQDVRRAAATGAGASARKPQQ